MWDVLACQVADLPAPELIDEVRRAYAENLVDPDFEELETIELDVLEPDPLRAGGRELNRPTRS